MKGERQTQMTVLPELAWEITWPEAGWIGGKGQTRGPIKLCQHS